MEQAATNAWSESPAELSRVVSSVRAQVLLPAKTTPVPYPGKKEAQGPERNPFPKPSLGPKAGVRAEEARIAEPCGDYPGL
jgi:hypothetical protein